MDECQHLPLVRSPTVESQSCLGGGGGEGGGGGGGGRGGGLFTGGGGMGVGGGGGGLCAGALYTRPHFGST